MNELRQSVARPHGIRFGCCHSEHLDRRHFLGIAASMAAIISSGVAQAKIDFPTTIAGISIPRTPLSQAALALCRRSTPDYLFNHCMRTYIFGALWAKNAGKTFTAEPAFVASALHDLGLMPVYESKEGSFEIDGASAASEFVKKAGLQSEAHLIWDAIAMHDKWSIASQQETEIAMVAAGAGADVVGVDPQIADDKTLAEVLVAFPRLGFKRQFAQLLTAHCRRKPFSQMGTWLDSYCRTAVPGAKYPSTAEAIANSGFSE